MEPCKHPFVWPDGNCVQCGVLATQFPAWAEPHHTMLPRKFEPLVKAFKDAEARKTRVMQANNIFTPRHVHSCPYCVFLGRWAEYDFYFCSGAERKTVIARYGNDPDEYLSGLDFTLAPLVIAEALAHRKGLL